MKKETLLKLSAGFALIAEALKSEVELSLNDTKETTQKDSEVQQKETTVTEVTNKEETKTVVNKSDDTKSTEELESMAYNDLKKLCKELGVPAKGGKTQLIEAILDSGKYSADEQEDTSKEEEEPKKSGKSTTSKVNKSQEPPVEEEEEDDTADEEEEKTLADEVAEATEDMSLEELAEILADAGLPTKGKRQALLARIVKGIEEGKIEWADEEVEDQEESDEEEEDTSNDNEARLEAIAEMEERVQEEVDSDDLTEEEIDEILEEILDDYDPNIRLDKKVDKLIEVYTNMIDDEGVEHDFSEPYVLNGKDYCCSLELEKKKKGKKYVLVCPVCGEEYPVED